MLLDLYPWRVYTTRGGLDPMRRKKKRNEDEKTIPPEVKKRIQNIAETVVKQSSTVKDQAIIAAAQQNYEKVLEVQASTDKLLELYKQYLADQITAQIQKEDEMVFLLMEFA